MTHLPIPHPSIIRELKSRTTARVGLARSGVSQTTRDQLRFQIAHAQARDAVHAALNSPDLLSRLAPLSRGRAISLRSLASTRAEYLRRPDLGRMVDEECLRDLPKGRCDLAFVLGDGLSALAVERHALPLLDLVMPALAGLKIAPIVVVEQARVAVGDPIGMSLGASLVVVLIGERPGLSSPDSLGAYLTWQPRVGRTDAERNCISNIRPEGLSYPEAAGQMLELVTAIRGREASGVKLVVPKSLPYLASPKSGL